MGAGAITGIELSCAGWRLAVVALIPTVRVPCNRCWGHPSVVASASTLSVAAPACCAQPARPGLLSVPVHWVCAVLGGRWRGCVLFCAADGVRYMYLLFWASVPIAYRCTCVMMILVLNA